MKELSLLVVWGIMCFCAYTLFNPQKEDKKVTKSDYNDSLKEALKCLDNLITPPPPPINHIPCWEDEDLSGFLDGSYDSFAVVVEYLTPTKRYILTGIRHMYMHCLKYGLYIDEKGKYPTLVGEQMIDFSKDTIKIHKDPKYIERMVVWLKQKGIKKEMRNNEMS